MRRVRREKGPRKTGKTGFIVTGFVLAVFVGFVILFHGPLRTLASFRKVDDFPLYTISYYGDYDLEDYLQEGLWTGHQSQSQGTRDGQACTCFAALNENGDFIFGRNFDWHTVSALLLFTNPPDGYASVSMVDITYFGYGTEEPSWIDRIRLLDAPYWPFDGMNERGLTVGMMAVPHAKASDDPQKVTVGSLLAIRLMLDYAKDVDEAISLLRSYNVDFAGGPPVHYLISDSSGGSAVVEFIDGEMSIIRSSEPWQVATNFVISGVSPGDAKASCRRYREAYETLEQVEGHISREDAMALLEYVSQSHTKWSIVYDLTSGDIQVAMGRKYNEVKTFQLELKDE
jgi:hypothetical protein